MFPNFSSGEKKKISIINIQNEQPELDKNVLTYFFTENDLQKSQFINYAANRSKRTISKWCIKAANKTSMYYKIISLIMIQCPQEYVKYKRCIMDPYVIIL